MSMRLLPPLLCQQGQQTAARMAEPADNATTAVLALSDFISEALLAYPAWRREIAEQPPHAGEWRDYAALLQARLETVSDEAALMRELRLFRRRTLARIGWSQILGTSETRETLTQLSQLAEVLIIAARDWLWQACCREWGTPCSADGAPQPLLVLGMGKLGGGELNFSSDIDLIFAYPENGYIRGGRRELDNAQFFTRLGQRLIKVLDQQTVDGFVYRVDMRLRPFGDSGPLVLSFSALEDYYQEQGRDWERYAMIKARLMGDDGDNYSQDLCSMLRPFIYRRYIDFSVIQSLRNMKQMIAREVRRRGLKDNIKLGAGGIREIEFIAQVFQLIRGGREPRLQQHALLPTLAAIGELGLLSQAQSGRLSEAYLYLRRLENLLQGINDEQTQTLPADALNQARLAWGMDEAAWPQLCATLTTHMQAVRTVFDELVGDDAPDAEENDDPDHYAALWLEPLSEEESEMPVVWQRLTRLVADFRRDVAKRTIGPRGREVLDLLMPRLLAQIGDQTQTPAEVVFERLSPMLLSIASRTTYLKLLLEYPGALGHLIRLCAASPMIASQLARHPLLLDELLNPATLYHPLAPQAYGDELRQYLLRMPEEDEEQQLEAMRQFKQAQQLRIAAADIAGVLPVMKVSDHLTHLAEAMIEGVIQQAWKYMVSRYGQPSHLHDGQDRGFAVIGYGKLGGWELGYSSDLDLVFLHNCPDDASTDGRRSIDGRQFYLRLAQRIMHLFSTRTPAGILYEVDARLRPSGAAGMLVSTLAAFEDYQLNGAWTWEHQALVRARMVYGAPALNDGFTAIRRRILCQPRDAGGLRAQVSEMRAKMRRHLAGKQADMFDIKADEGGITNIEFLAQYLVLRHAAGQPELTRWSDNVRIFELMARYGIISGQDAGALRESYITLRDAIHHLALQALPGRAPSDRFRDERALIGRCWKQWLD